MGLSENIENFNDYVSEAEALSDRYDDIEDNDYISKEEVLEEIEKDEIRYIKNKESKVGSIIKCANALCKRNFKKKSYQQAFCCKKCKNQFWNRRSSNFGVRIPIVY